jgi:hypothetical protein
LLNLAQTETPDVGQFESVRIVSFSWNEKVRRASTDCDKPLTNVSWTPDRVNTTTRLQPVRSSSVQKKDSYSTRAIRREVAPTPVCEIIVDLFLAPRFQGLKRNAQFARRDGAHEITIPYSEDYELSPPSPAFWRGDLALSYDAGPLSFDIRVPLDSMANSRIIPLPGWTLRMQAGAPVISFDEIQ